VTEPIPARLLNHLRMKPKLLMASRAGASAVVAVVIAAPHMVAAIAVGATLLALLVFLGIALPAVWSSKPARRRAAAAVLEQILATLRRRGSC